MTARIIDGKVLAANIQERVRQQIEELGEPALRLVSVAIGEDPASEVYIRNQRRNCDRMGIRFEELRLGPATSEAELIDRIQRLNGDPAVTGILLQRPLPRGLRLLRLQSKIHPDKDVEGLNPANIGDIVYGRPRLVPCTAAAAMRCLHSTGIPLKGADAVMVGHSEVVGKPIAFLMLNFFATTTICHVATQDLARKTRNADILFTAVGKPGLITASMVKPGAVVIDIGITQVAVLDREGSAVLDEQGRPRQRLVGDVAFDEVRSQAGFITPVPGGVGPVTVAMLMHNTMLAARLQRGLAVDPLPGDAPFGGERTPAVP